MNLTGSEFLEHKSHCLPVFIFVPNRFSAELSRERHTVESAHLQALGSVGVDLTQYLVNQQQLQPDEVLQVVRSGAATGKPSRALQESNF